MRRYKKIKSLPIDEDFLYNDTSIEELWFRCNLTSMAQIPDLKPFKSLKVLDLSNNVITSLDNIDNFNELNSLNRLDLHNNRITSLVELNGLSSINNISILNLSGNNIERICIDDNNNLQNLLKLDLSHNKIQKIQKIKNLPKLVNLNLDNNQISRLENLFTLPRLEYIGVRNNPIKSVDPECLLKLPSPLTIDDITCESLYCDQREPAERDELVETMWELGFDKDVRRHEDGNWDEEFAKKYNYNENPYEWHQAFEREKVHYSFIYQRLPPSQVCKVNEFLTVKLERAWTYVYVNGRRVRNCMSVFVHVPPGGAWKGGLEIDSIDELVEKYAEKIAPGEHEQYFNNPYELSASELFWAHCSNFQAWTELEYDTRALHSNVAFPLLKKLAEAGDKTALRVFKDEIAKRYSSGCASVIEFLTNEGYLDYLSEEELNMLNSEI
ncbi:MAG: leucine-rich repeat domain-containing protein [Candidatus Lokiarchaeota archaeon]|nr:leucine-rich repeat domain-containing protein [Candidatus Lokiarchaeota archaeon]